MILAIDPGSSKAHAWADFDQQGILRQVGLCMRIEDLPWEGCIEVIIEVPRNYSGFGKAHRTLKKMRAKISKIERMAQGKGIAVLKFYPSEWKGNLPKIVCHRRTENLLSQAERRELPDLAVRGNDDVWDAVGIGLVGLNRARRGLLPSR